MASLGRTKQDRKQPEQPVAGDDPVLGPLAQAEASYKELRASWERQTADFRAAWERQAAELHQAQQALAAAQASAQQLSNNLQASQDHLEAERRKSEQRQQEGLRQRERANQLAAALKDIHRSFFSGDLYSQILRACLTLTGATRGLYLTMREAERVVRVRAAVGVDGYPASAPSEYIKALCAKVVDENRTILCNQADDLSGLPAPRDAAETFRNCIVTPVVLLKNFDGVMIVADKTDGEFEADDIDLLVSVGDQAAVAVENMHLQRELQSAYLSTVSVLADAVEAKDSYTQGHCEMVSRYARLTAERLGLSDYNRSVVCYAALLHDVGKIGVSDGVLNKPGLLSVEERELVRSHVRVGHSLISHIHALNEVANVVLHHHEWWNGTGYPDGLAGEEIPLASRIICVVDAYCAMITRRSYKEAFSDERARDELMRYAGTQFDPRVVQAFLEILDTPAAQDLDVDEDAECGLLPTFSHLYNLQDPAR